MRTAVYKMLFTLAVCQLTIALSAQQKKGGIGDEEVIVVKEYEATIQDAQKINMQPAIPEVQETKPKLDYTIPTAEFKDISFEPNPLRPLSISKEKLEKYNSSFIKLGFGSQLMPLAQLAYNDNKTRNLKFGIFYDHLSAKGYKIKNQQFSDDLAGIYLKYFPKKFEIGTNFTFHNYRTHFYGTDSSYTEKSVRQYFRTFDAGLYLKNAAPNKAGVDFKQTANFNYLLERFGRAREWYVAGQTDLQKTFKTYHTIKARFNFDISQLHNDSLALTRTIFTPMIGYAFNNGDWKAWALLGVAIDGKKPVFAADVHVEKRLYENSIILYINYLHGDQKNSLLSLSQINNFMQSTSVIKNSTVGDFGIGLKGTATDFSYNIAFHLNHVVNMPFFVNDTTDMKRFVTVYDPNTLQFNFHFEAGYNAKEWLRLLVLSDYNFYKLKTEAYPWHEPAFKATLRGNYVWKDKISVTLDLYGLTASYAKLPDNKVQKLRGTADINLGAEYLFNKHLSFFAMLNNVANIKYQRWYHYPGYGFNAMIGGKFSF